MFIDLICSRKIEIMNRKAKILEVHYILEQIDNICTVVGKLEECRKEHGETVARAVFNTIKAQDGMINAESEAIARVTGSRDALAGRTIAASSTDRVHHWYNLSISLSDPKTATLTSVHFGQTIEAPAPRKAPRKTGPLCDIAINTVNFPQCGDARAR